MLALREGLKRLVQIIFSLRVFDLPPLFQLRGLAYKTLFNGGKGLTIGRNCFFICADFYYEQSKIGSLRIGENVAINHNVELDYSGGMTIGDDVWISQDVLIETHSHAISPGKKADWPIVRSSLEIEDDVWIGAKAVITSNVKRIGRGAIIGACTVVTKDVPAFAIVAGVPGRIIKQRPIE